MDALIPPWFRNLLIVGAIGYAGWLLFDYGRDVQAQADALELTQAAAHASESQRADEGATAEAQKEGADAQIQAIQTLVGQRNAADLAAERLRRQLAETIRTAAACGAPGDPAAESGRTAVAALGAAFEACDSEQRALAADVAERYITGQRCEAEYDALTPNATPDEGSGL